MSATRITIVQVSNALKISKRSVQRLAQKLMIPQDAEGYILNDDVLRQMRQARHGEGATSRREPELYGVGLHKQNDGTIMQVFTEEEYKQFEQALIERKQLKEQIRQLQDWKDSFVRYTQERNLIEAKDKGLLNLMDAQETEEADNREISMRVIEKRSEILRDKGNVTIGDDLNADEKRDFYKWMRTL